MPPLAIYTLCLAGAIGLFLIMRPGDGSRRSRGLRGLGLILGIGVVAFLGIQVVTALAGNGPGPFVAIFGLISIISAAQMITTSKPVYSALHFVLVVLASSGLFLMLEAEFMAFALIIVYAGAILITYMFVLMLAQQAPNPEDEAGEADYDLHAREPAAGAIVAFVLLALLTSTLFDGAPGATPRQSAPEAMVASWARLDAMPGQIEEAVADLDAAVRVVRDEAGRPIFDLSIVAGADLDGVRRVADLDPLTGPGVRVVEVATPVTLDDMTLTSAVFEIDARAAGIDVSALLAEPTELAEAIRFVLGPRGIPVLGAGENGLAVSQVGASVQVVDADGVERFLALPNAARPDNIQEVGLALITAFPASLEVAGVILLMAMFGAVILARRQIEIGEDEKRTAAGLRPLGDYDEADDAAGDAAAGDPA